MNKLTSSQRSLLSKAFSLAKYSLNDGTGHAYYQTKYICYALETQMIDGNFSRDTYAAATSIIRDRLGHHLALDSWLIANGVPAKKINYRNLQEHRHAWLDKLAEEFSH